MTENSTPTSEVFTPKKSNLSRKAISQNAVRKSLVSGDNLPIPIRHAEDRPSYSAEHLSELKGSTPSTPKDLKSLEDVELSTSKGTLDIASKFGTDLAAYSASTHSNGAIPTDAEIQEKKIRRARLAKEQKYNPRKHKGSSSPSNSDNSDADGHSDVDLEQRDSDEDEFRTNTNTISLLPSSRSKHPETRLVRDDEDIMEDFDAFVEDGGITLGRAAERAQRAKRKTEMADLIAEAEGEGADGDAGDESDDSEVERRAEYEAAQTRKGLDGLRVTDEDEERTWGGRTGIKTPPRITPLPSLGGCLERLRKALGEVEARRAGKIKELEACEKERAEIKVREVEVQQALREVGKRYEALRAEAGLDEGDGVSRAGSIREERGLESLGGTPSAAGTPLAQAVGD